MANWHYYSNLMRHLGIEGSDRGKEEWYEERLRVGKRARKNLPIQGELNWPNASLPPVPSAVIPKGGISRLGLVNKIWVPGTRDEIRIGDESFLGLHVDTTVYPGSVLFYIWRGLDRNILLLSRKKPKIIPYLWNTWLDCRRSDFGLNHKCY